MIKRFIRKKLISLVSDEKRKTAFKSLNTIHRLLILFDAADYNEIKRFIETLKQKEKKEVVACCYVSKKNPDTTLSDAILLRQKEDMNWMNIPSGAFINKLNQVHYDAVIDLSLNDNLAMEYVLANIHCSFKIGIRKKEFPLYDLTISSSDNDPLSIDYFGKQLLHYLKEIRSGNK